MIKYPTRQEIREAMHSDGGDFGDRGYTKTFTRELTDEEKQARREADKTEVPTVPFETLKKEYRERLGAAEPDIQALKVCISRIESNCCISDEDYFQHSNYIDARLKVHPDDRKLLKMKAELQKMRGWD